MKPFKFFIREDFGTEYCLALFQFKNRTLLQFSFDWNDYESRPYLIVYLGLNSLLDILFSCGKLGLCVEILAQNWEVDGFATDYELPNF